MSYILTFPRIMPPRTPTTSGLPCDRLVQGSRRWMRRSWGRSLATVVGVFADGSETKVVERSCGRPVAEPPSEFSGTIDEELFHLAREWGVEHRGEYPYKLRLVASDGSFAELVLPPNWPTTGHEDVEPDPPHHDGPEEPRATGWRFNGDTATYCQTSFVCCGDPMELLQLLVEANGQAVSNVDLCRDLWPGQSPDFGKLRKVVSRLRAKLKDRIPAVTEPIVTEPSGYRLAIF